MNVMITGASGGLGRALANESDAVGSKSYLLALERSDWLITAKGTILKGSF